MIAARSVPIARRQLLSERSKLAVTVLAVAAAVALVLLLSGLRRGIGEQVTLYVDRQPPVLVAQAGARNFLAQTSVLPEGLGKRVERVPGVAAATPISQQFAMFTLHERRVLAILIGYDPGKAGGPWELASGRAPHAAGELVLDRVVASEHGLRPGSTLAYRGARLRVVGLSSGTSGFMTPIAFVTRQTANALRRQSGTANFFLVQPDPGVTPVALAARIERQVAGVSALTRTEVAANDRSLFATVFSKILLPMVAIAFAVAILVIGLAVYSSTAERSREYATLKALGLRSSALLRLVGVQAAALALAGSALGTLLGFAAARGISSVAPKYLVAIGPETVAFVAASALAMAIVAALLPARFVARIDPATAFRR
ncbi:MAG TPA: ABC transporter permease [Gaiellaceae bacterium]|nr:ABC transporter permease [Gaiellaceae bacterium]